MRSRGQRAALHGQKVSFPTRNGSMNALIYNKKNNHPGYLLVEVHGGGFMYNTAADDDDLCETLHQSLGIPVVACDYALSPEKPFPAGLQDVYDCVCYALNRKELLAEPDKIILLGHSAGANLAAGAAYMAVQNHKQDFSPYLLVLDYPYMDPFRSSDQRKHIPMSVPGVLMDTFAHYYTDTKEALRDILISPILFSPESFTEMPETYILLCGRDNLNQGGYEYARLLHRAGVPVSGCYVKKALHGFIENHFNYKYIPLDTKIQITRKQHELARKSVSRICQWISDRL